MNTSNADWKFVNIDKCLSEKIQEEEKLEIEYKHNIDQQLHQNSETIEKILTHK